MATDYSVDELLKFLGQAAGRGLMPAATAQALAVASRGVFEILSDEERADVRRLDVGAIVKRFSKRRAKDFNPSSLKEYGRRAQRAVDLFRQWRDAPDLFSAPTRSTGSSRRRAALGSSPEAPSPEGLSPDTGGPLQRHGRMPSATSVSGYQTAFPVRPDTVVTLLNIPTDLSRTEAERLAQFVRMLAVE